MGKAWEQHRGGRKKEKRQQRISFHILCEGQNTEPDYFRQFPISNINAFCKGYGQSKTALVDTAIKYKRRQNITKKSPDQIWVVFDFDKKGDVLQQQKQDYNAAIELSLIHI